MNFINAFLLVGSLMLVQQAFSSRRLLDAEASSDTVLEANSAETPFAQCNPFNVQTLGITSCDQYFSQFYVAECDFLLEVHDICSGSLPEGKATLRDLCPEECAIEEVHPEPEDLDERAMTNYVQEFHSNEDDGGERRELSHDWYAWLRSRECHDDYYDKTGNKNWYYWACGHHCVGGQYLTDYYCHCACKDRSDPAPNLADLNLKLAQAIRDIAAPYGGMLDIDGELLAKLGGHCGHIDDYFVIQDNNEDNQCGRDFFAQRDGIQANQGYSPNDLVKTHLQQKFGIHNSNDLNIDLVNAGSGKWCGMPAPTGTGFGKPEDYWKQCVQPKSGYFNTLKCSGVGGSTYAVLGLMAVNENVCYPAHAHLNEEVYWQVAGTGTWKAWSHPAGTDKMREIQEQHINYATHQGNALDTYEELESNTVGFADTRTINRNVLGNYFGVTRHQHTGGIPHEMETAGDEFMLTVYWWAKDEVTFPTMADTKYHFSHYVSDSCREGRIHTTNVWNGCTNCPPRMRSFGSMVTIPNDNIDPVCGP